MISVQSPETLEEMREMAPTRMVTSAMAQTGIRDQIGAAGRGKAATTVRGNARAAAQNKVQAAANDKPREKARATARYK